MRWFALALAVVGVEREISRGTSICLEASEKDAALASCKTIER